jgi:diguanylate cyclase (GGDEF)-like protein
VPVPAKLLTVCFVSWMTALTGAFYALPSWRMLIWGAIGTSSAAALLAGTIRNRPRRRIPWLLQAAAVLALCSGDTVYNLLIGVFGHVNPFPSVADVFYLCCSFPLQAIGLILLARSGTSWRDRASLIDTLLLTAGIGLVVWVLLISPFVVDPRLTLLEKLVSVAYPLGDVLVLATVIRLVVTVRHTRAVALLTLGGFSLLASDIVYSLGQLDLYGLGALSGNWQGGGPVDLGWIVFYTAWGAAALHPSMVDLTEPRVPRPTQLTPQRLVLLALSSLVGPIILLRESLDGPVSNGTSIALMCMIMFTLVLLRLSGVVTSHRRTLARERALRNAGAALVSATDVSEVEQAVRTAVCRLLAPNTPHQVLLALADGSGGQRDGLCYVSTLPPKLAERLTGFDVALLCPMVVEERPLGVPEIGFLLVAAAELRLVGLERAVDVLAAQAALALERVSLSAEINRRRSEEYFRTLVQNTADVIVILDPTDRIQYASPSAATMFRGPDLVGRRVLSLVHPKDRPAALVSLSAVRSGDGDERATSWRMVSAAFEETAAPTAADAESADPALAEVEAEVSFRDLRGDRTVEGVVLTLRDVTEQRRLERELTKQAFYDSLTGLANRALFSERMHQAAQRAERSGVLSAVLYIDLDDFKVVNDTLGHTAGDALLVAVGERLVGVTRAQDTIARIGGDEFAAVIENITDPEELDEIARRVSATLAAPIMVGEHLLSGVASIGIATTAEAADGSDLLRQADLALYEAKGAGGGQWRRYQSALHDAVLERMALRAALEKAVTEEAFVLQYQPIVELESGVTVGFEALVRWQHPERGTVPPADFIEVAEDSGLIVPIGGWVLRHAVATAAGWGATGGNGRVPYISVNVSARQFRTPGFPEEVSDALGESGLPPGNLLLEITESLLLRDDEQVWTDLAALRELGVRVAIDDFGTGYSSLSYLRQRPIDVVKIDKSFIETVGSSRQQRALVDGIVRLAQTLELQVVAEGIEQPAERVALAGMGCPFGQGYLFSQPLSYRDAARWVRAERVAA